MYWPSFLYELLVASDSVVKLRLSLVRTSASLPMKPMRVTLFWYMVVISVLLKFPILLGSLISEVGPAPKCQGVLSWWGPEEVCAVHLPRVYKLVLGGTETLKGRCKRSRTTPSRRAPVWPRSSDRAKGGIRNGRLPLDRSHPFTSRLRKFEQIAANLA